MRFSYKNIAITVIIFSVILATFLFLIADRSAPPAEEGYILKEYNNTVALYKGEKVLNVYDGIVVSSLPNDDRQRLKNGIKLRNPEDAQAIIEDYDG